MNRQQIEIRAQQVIDRIRAAGPSEDSLIELKRIWTDPKAAARQLAGHANSAQGEPIIWLVGVDEKQGVVGATQQDLASWWPQVQKLFDSGISPDLSHDLIIHDEVSGQSYIALQFETDRSPYVSIGDNGVRSVLFRQGERNEPATRSQLLRILAPIQALPHVDLLHAHMHLLQKSAGPLGDTSVVNVYIRFYVTPRSNARLFLPTHKRRCELHANGEWVPSQYLELYRYTSRHPDEGGGEFEPHETPEDHHLVIDDPGLFQVLAQFHLRDQFDESLSAYRVRYRFPIAGEENRGIVGDLPVELVKKRKKESNPSAD